MLTVLEIILGIDNIIFISIVCDKLPVNYQNKARKLGLTLALVVRLLLLSMIKWIMELKNPLFSIPFLSDLHVDPEFSGRDLILLFGGLFLIYKSIMEIHHKLEDKPEDEYKSKKMGFTTAIVQIIILDLVFSFDSILTAVGIADQLPVMIVAVIIAVSIMIAFAKAVNEFISARPTIKMLALSFLVMIGFLLVAEGLGEEIPKGYVYFSMGFAFLVEMLNLRARKNSLKVVKEKKPIEIDD